MARTPPSDLSARTARGMVWAYSSFVASRLAILLTTAILARLLTPAQFGVVALALVFITLFETVSDLGLNQALIVAVRGGDEEIQRRNTVFAGTVGLGFVVALAVACLAPVAANFFDVPALTWLLPVLCVSMFFRALGQTHYALAQQDLDFRSRTVAEVVEAAARGVTGITLALSGMGAWSLVLAHVAGTLAFTTVMWRLVPWRPSGGPKRVYLPELVRFGGSLTLLNVMAAVIADIDYLFIGRVLGPRELGLYTLGFRLPEMLVLNISLVAGKVLFPAFAVVDRAELGRVVVRAFRYTMIVAVPIAAGLVGLARPIVQVVFGDQWLGSVTVMQLITGYVLAVTIGIPAGTMYKSIGRVDVLLRLAVPRLVLVVTGIALTVHRGIESVATVQLVVAALFSAIGILIAPRYVGTSLRELWSAAWPALLGGLVILLTCAATLALFSQPIVRLLVATAAGGTAYIGVLALTARPDLMGLLDALGLTGHGRPRLGGAKRRGGG